MLNTETEQEDVEILGQLLGSMITRSIDSGIATGGEIVNMLEDLIQYVERGMPQKI